MRTLLATALTGVLLAACTSEQTVIPNTAPIPTAGAPGTGVATIPDDRLRAALQDASDTERPLIEDGQLTFDEYERATLDTVACIQSLGLNIKSSAYLAGSPRPGLILLAGDTYEYSGYVEGRELTGTEYSGMRQCQAAFSAVVTSLWIELTGPTLQDVVSARAELAECLLAKGIEVPSLPDRMDLERAAFPPDGEPRGRAVDIEYRACIVPIADAHGIHVAGGGF